MTKKNLLFNILLFNLFLLITLYTKNWWLTPLILFYLGWILYEYGWKSLVSILFIILLCFSINNSNNKEINHKLSHKAKIVKIYSSSIVVNEDGQNYYLMGIKENYIVGDEISFNAMYKENDEISSFDVFYKSTKSNGLAYANNIKVISHNKNLRNNTYNLLLEDNSTYSDFALAMLYKTKTDGNATLLDNINKLGIPHLFVLSGFHITIFYLFIEKLCGGVIVNKKIVDTISFGSILFFLYLVYFPPTGIRALLTMVIIKIGNLSKIDSLSLTGIIFFILNPFLMIGNSMILSFSITAMIYESSSKKGNRNKRILNKVTISSSAFFLSIPTILTWNPSVNLFSPILSIILTPIISISYIICILILPFHYLWGLFSTYFYLLNIIISLLLFMYFPLSIGIISPFMQIYLVSITFLYIIKQKENNLILLNTFFILSLIFIII